MTFISSFRSIDGVVLGADSQETIGDWKLSVDKLEPRKTGNYELAIGGAGLGALVDSLFDHVQEWVEELDVVTERELIRFLRGKLREFYAGEVAAYPSKQGKTIEAILCMKHVNRPEVFNVRIHSTVPRRAGPFSLISLDAPMLQHFVKRLYRPNLPISQCVLLTIYLFSIAGSISTAVGGETRVVIARDNGIRLHEALYVDKIQENMKMFTMLIDKLMLSCPDTSLSAPEFDKVLKEFSETANHVRKEFLFEMSRLAFEKAISPNYPGDSYAMIPPGTSLTVKRGEMEYKQLREASFKCNRCFAEFEYVSDPTRQLPVLVPMNCPDCSEPNTVISTVVKIRKVGAVAWTDVPSQDQSGRHRGQ